MENNTTSKRKASSQCPPTLSEKFGQKEGGLALFEFLKGKWIFSGGGGGR